MRESKSVDADSHNARDRAARPCRTFIYLAENAGLETADRFLVDAEVSFNDLARQPKMGAPLTLKHPNLADIRKWRIKGFDNHLVFHEPRTDGVSIVRVLHAASDWWQMLGLEARPEAGNLAMHTTARPSCASGVSSPAPDRESRRRGSVRCAR